MPMPRLGSIYLKALTGTLSRPYSQSHLPLHGIKVVDLTRVLAGPYCTQLLGDMGADVIKVEHPTRGDDTRAWGPPFLARKDTSTRSSGESAYYLGVNRNKRSIALDFKSDQGRKVVHELIRNADVVVENYVPGTLAKYGLDYTSARALNPGIIYASITGYGQTGPYRQRPGYDVMVEAEFGLMHITGEPEGSPVKVGVAVTDLTTGLYAVNSILGSLFHKTKTGQGQYLDICLSDCQTATLANIAASALVSGTPDSGRQGTAHPSICPYQAFETLHGGSIMIGGGNDKLFGLVCDALEKPEWKLDPRFTTNALRVEHRHILVPAITAVTKTKSTEHWISVFERFSFPFAPVNDIQTTLNHPHTLARNMVVDVDHPYCGPLKLVNHPVKWSETQPDIRRAPPVLGQHTDEVLQELGYSTEAIDDMQKDGIVNCTESSHRC